MQQSQHLPAPGTLGAVQARLAGLRTGPSSIFGPLEVVALLGADLGTPPVLGTDALKSGGIVVNEVSDGGVVAELRARNSSADAVLFLLGDELLGGKQHRVVNTHVLIRPGADFVLSVSCIEGGRWSRTDPGRTGFLCRKAPLSVHSDLRTHLARQTRASLRRTGRARSDQGDVWQEVDRFSSSRGVRSRTSALSDALDDPGSSELSIEAAPEQVGFVAWAGGRLVGLELFGSSRVLRGSLQRLLRSAASSSWRSRGAAASRDVATGELLASLRNLDWRSFEGVGDGVELRATVEGAEVVSLVNEDALVALSVLAA